MSAFELFGTIVLVSTASLVFVCFLLYTRIQRSTHFKCPHCGKRFKVPAAKSFFAVRNGVDKRLICPACGKIDFMEYLHDTDIPQEQRSMQKEQPREQNISKQREG
jgi:predicted RNA-binding Zn-ribbon protein involved in translation (DUF1610 family)